MSASDEGGHESHQLADGRAAPGVSQLVAYRAQVGRMCGLPAASEPGLAYRMEWWSTSLNANQAAGLIRRTGPLDV